MKYILTILIFLSIISCNDGADELIGSWKNKEMTDVRIAGPNVIEKITFFENDSGVKELIRNNKRIDRYSFSFKYNFDRNAKIIDFYQDEPSGMRLKILKLNDSEMELLNSSTKKPMRYERIK